MIGTNTGVGGGTSGAAAAPVPGVVTVNDNTTGTGDNEFDYVGNWGFSASSYAFDGDNHWSNTTDDCYLVRFNGTQITLYCPLGPKNGEAAVSVDDGPETTVDLYDPSDLDSSAVYTSSILSSGPHTLKVRVTGQSSSTGYYVNADRVDITTGSTATATPTATPAVAPTPAGSSGGQ